ncbi:MAG: hypothetical protein ACREJM_02150, partial [Candidatus Saccharimonadales bacterium]
RECSRALCRGPVATKLALTLRAAHILQAVGYDGRGAAAAEWNEYDIAPNARWRDRIAHIERIAVTQSDVRLAVSEKLVAYWRERFAYDGKRHVVVPCTLSSHHPRLYADRQTIQTRRKQLGFSPDGVVICYSGSSADWQSLHLLDYWLGPIMERQSTVSLLMMSRANLDALGIGREFSGRIRQVWVAPQEVAGYIAMAYYGFLMREGSVTNAVAAPTKFAEYLAAGLKILISPNLGDYSALVQDHALGHVMTEPRSAPPLVPTSVEERERLIEFAHHRFSKSHYREAYRTLLLGLGPRAVGADK